MRAREREEEMKKGMEGDNEDDNMGDTIPREILDNKMEGGER